MLFMIIILITAIINAIKKVYFIGCQIIVQMSFFSVAGIWDCFPVYVCIKIAGITSFAQMLIHCFYLGHISGSKSMATLEGFEIYHNKHHLIVYFIVINLLRLIFPPVYLYLFPWILPNAITTMFKWECFYIENNSIHSIGFEVYHRADKQSRKTSNCYM